MAKIKTHLPDYYKNSRYFKDMAAAGDKEFDHLHARIEQADRNSVVDTADEDGLEVFERDFCIKAASDTDEVRKGRIKAKMRGAQPTTEDNLRNSLRLFDPAADIEQHPSDYSFDIHIEAPDMLPEIMNITEEIKPAHLGVGYSVTPASVKNTLYFGTTMSIRGRINVPMRQYNTYSDITDVELNGKTYEDILYKE